ncbi:MAG: hypothetical protein PHP92_05590 [Candidatus Nanoarchaeia archaeon]|nr:hypothetical protein [Candidatus Nanoarchaeia archaeon]
MGQKKYLKKIYKSMHRLLFIDTENYTKDYLSYFKKMLGRLGYIFKPENEHLFLIGFNDRLEYKFILTELIKYYKQEYDEHFNPDKKKIEEVPKHTEKCDDNELWFESFRNATDFQDFLSNLGFGSEIIEVSNYHHRNCGNGFKLRINNINSRTRDLMRIIIDLKKAEFKTKDEINEQNEHEKKSYSFTIKPEILNEFTKFLKANWYEFILSNDYNSSYISIIVNNITESQSDWISSFKETLERKIKNETKKD